MMMNMNFAACITRFQYFWVTATVAVWCHKSLERNLRTNILGRKNSPPQIINVPLEDNSALNYSSLSYAKFFVLLNKLFSMKECRQCCDTWKEWSNLHHCWITPKIFSALSSALAWLDVTDYCLLSHNTSWDHRRGTPGFPPEAARRTEETRDQTAWGTMHSGVMRSAAGGRRRFAARLWPRGAGLRAPSVNLIREMLHALEFV